MPDILIPALTTTSLLFALGAASLALASARLKIEVDPFLDGLELSNRADDAAEAGHALVLALQALGRVDAGMAMLRRASARNQLAAALTIIAVLFNGVAFVLQQFFAV